MRYVKPLAAALMALGFSVPVLAQNVVCFPSQHGGFKVAINEMYLRQNSVSAESESNYNWGTYAQIGYLFPATANDLTVNYTYLHSNHNDGMDLDTVDLEGGQRFTTGSFDIRMFAGVRYSHINYSFDNDIQSMSSKFHGFGPRVGVDTRYQLTNGFGLDTHLNTGLVVGKLSSLYQQNYSEEKPGLIEQQSESMNHVMPHAGAKIGLDYTYAMQDYSKSALVFEVGYQADHYFKALKNVNSGISNDLSTSGPYIEVKYYA